MRVTRGCLPALFGAALTTVATAAGALDVGDPAPGFAVESTTGLVKLTDFQGTKNVLLAFYLKDFTRG